MKYFLPLTIILIAAATFLLNDGKNFFYNKGESTVLFVGDINLDRHIREVISEKGGEFVFSCIGDVLKSADLVVGNLEGPITDNPSVSVGTAVGSPANYVFTFPPSSAQLLSDFNIKLVNIGNNHINDFKNPGILSTQEYLESSGINYFGGIKGNEPVYRVKLGGTQVAFISFNQFYGSSAEEVARAIEKENESGSMVVVYAHWGEEYGPVTDYQKRAAKIFSEAGARAVIGSHPHIISLSEKIGDTIVYYSLGNFIFDQYWNPEVRTGLMLDMTIKDKQIKISERKVVLTGDGRTCLAIN